MSEEVYEANVKSLKRQIETAERNLRISKEEHEITKMMGDTVKTHTTKEME